MNVSSISIWAAGRTLAAVRGAGDRAPRRRAVHDSTARGSVCAERFARLRLYSNRANRGRRFGAHCGGCGHASVSVKCARLRSGSRSNRSGHRCAGRSDCRIVGGARCAGSRGEERESGAQFCAYRVRRFLAGDLSGGEYGTGDRGASGAGVPADAAKFLVGNGSVHDGTGPGGCVRWRHELRNGQSIRAMHGNDQRSSLQQELHGYLLRRLPRPGADDLAGGERLQFADWRLDHGMQCGGVELRSDGARIVHANLHAACCVDGGWRIERSDVRLAVGSIGWRFAIVGNSGWCWIGDLRGSRMKGCSCGNTVENV